MSTRPYKPAARWEADYLSKAETQAVVTEILASGRYTRQTLAAQLGITPGNITHYLAGRARAPKRVKRFLPRAKKIVSVPPQTQELDAIRAAQRVKNEEAIKWLKKLRAELPKVDDDSELIEWEKELDQYRTHRKLFRHDRLS